MGLYDATFCEVRCLKSIEEIQAAAQAWQSLSQRQSDPTTYFQAFDWCNSWCLANADVHDWQPKVFTFWNGDQLVAVLPLMKIYRLGLNRLVPLGFPETQYGGWLVDDQLVDQHDLKNWWDWLNDQSSSDCLLIDDLPAQSKLAGVLKSKAYEYNPGETAQTLDLTQFETADALAASLSRNKRKYRNRRLKKLGQQGDVALCVYPAGTDRYRDLVTRALQWKEGWLSSRGHPMPSDKKERLSRLLLNLEGADQKSASPPSGAMALVLTVGGLPIAVEIGFAFQRYYYSYLGAYDEAWSNYSPGKIQIQMAQEWAIENGLVAYDLMADGGGGDYKSSNANSEMDLVSLGVPLSFKGMLYCRVWLNAVRPACYSVFTRLSPKLKARIVALRSLASRGGAKHKVRVGSPEPET